MIEMFLDANWRRELAHAARGLRRAPGFAAIAIVTLAIGVGVNTAMFGLIDALLFRPPPHVGDPDRVVRVRFTSGDAKGEAKPWRRSNYPALAALADTRAFESVAGYTDATVSIGRGVEAYEAKAMIVTPAFFRVLGVRPHAGSLFGSQAADTLADNRVVLSYGFWQRRFGRDPRVIGAPLVIGSAAYFIAGIAPNGFTALQESPVDVWLPMNELAAAYLTREWRTNHRSYWLDVVARVPSSATVTAAQNRASAVLRLAAPTGDRDPTGAVTAPIVSSRDAEKSREVRVSLWLAGVAAFVLLIACANIANLMLARNVVRGREYAVRLSLGATNWQLRRQLLADVLVLAIPGLVAALFVEHAVRAAIPAFLPTEIPIPRGLIDARSLGLMMTSGLVAVALVAVVSLAQVRPERILRALVVRTIDERRGGAWTRGSLLALQSGLCVALLFSAGLFARSLGRVLALDLGVELDRAVQMSFNIPRGSRAPAERGSLYDRALERVRALQGVERAALSVSAPYQSGMGSAPFTAEQTQRELWEGKGEVAYSTAVGAGFFGTVGARSLAGRDFTDADRAGAPLVAIVNRNQAARLWPAGGALGRCLFLDEQRECYRVVGVLGGVWKLRALDRSKMTVYTPLAQTPDASAGALLVRTRGPAGPMLAQLRSAVQSIEPDLPAVNVSRTRDLVDSEFRPWRLGATLFGGFSAIALIIAAVGLFGVVSFTTTLRTREIGVRMALGARGSNVMRLVAGDGLVAVVAGLILGAGASLVASRWMGDVLYQTSPRDPAVLAQTAGVLLLVAGVAVIAPVLRALRLAPAAILRSE
jgi:predicted permease